MTYRPKVHFNRNLRVAGVAEHGFNAAYCNTSTSFGEVLETREEDRVTCKTCLHKIDLDWMDHGYWYGDIA